MIKLTVSPCVGAAYGRKGGSTSHYELVEVALVVGGLGLCQHHVVYV
jgi:hypothetical protein